MRGREDEGRVGARRARLVERVRLSSPAGPPSERLELKALRCARCRYFYPPTLITGTDTVPATSLRIWREEAFGPVLVLVPFETEAQAIALANDSEYGLGAPEELFTRSHTDALTPPPLDVLAQAPPSGRVTAPKRCASRRRSSMACAGSTRTTATTRRRRGAA